MLSQILSNNDPAREIYKLTQHKVVFITPDTSRIRN